MQVRLGQLQTERLGKGWEERLQAELRVAEDKANAQVASPLLPPSPFLGASLPLLLLLKAELRVTEETNTRVSLSLPPLPFSLTVSPLLLPSRYPFLSLSVCDFLCPDRRALTCPLRRQDIY